jgi:hypothetical protein
MLDAINNELEATAKLKVNKGKATAKPNVNNRTWRATKEEPEKSLAAKKAKADAEFENILGLLRAKEGKEKEEKARAKEALTKKCAELALMYSSC